MAQTVVRFGAANNVGTTYVSLGTVPALTVENLVVSCVNRSAAPILVRVFVATASWTTGEPTAGALVTAVEYDTPLTAGQVFQVPWVVMNAGEQLVVRSSAATSADFMASGIANT